MSMRRLLCTALACMATAGTAMAQIVQWPLNNENGCTAGAPIVTSGLSASFICRGAGLTFTNGTAGRNYISSNWTVGGTDADAVTNNDYLEFTLTPSAGFKATVTDVTIRTQRSNSGAQTLAIRSSLDGYTTTLTTVSVPSGTTASRVFDFVDIETCDPVTFRIYGYGATGTGTCRLEATVVGATDGIVVNGTVAAGTCTAVTGACCIAGVCNTTTTQVDCTSLGGFYGGDGTSCPSFSCPAVGACCFPNGTCQFLTASNCTAQGGTYQMDNLPCANANCPLPVGGCCIAGICFGTDVTEQDCVGSSGTWLGAGVACNQGVNCIEPTGACCNADGTCSTGVTQAACVNAGGVYRGNNSTCTTANCLYACCFSDGTCTVVSRNACSTAGGTPGANNSQTCSPNNCPQPTALGACCIGTACTAAQSYADCNTAGGIWLGKGTTCTAGVCDQASGPSLIAKYDFDVNRQATSFTVTTGGTPPFPAGDAFGVVQRFRAWPEPVPFSLLDDSVSLFPFVDMANPGDPQGIITEAKVDNSFGMVDIFDIVQPGATNEALAQWDFDITGESVASISFDAAAMGDFEGLDCSTAPNCLEDRVTITYQIDANPEVEIFRGRAASPNGSVMLTYTMAGGQMFTLDDPLVDTISMTTLNNSFQTFTFTTSGVTGSVLALRLRAQMDGASEAFALDNIMIMSAPGCPAQFTLANFDDTGASMGVVDVVDLFAFLDAWFAQTGVCVSGCSADVAPPFGGSPDVTDLFDFLDAWFAQNGTMCP